MVFVPHCEEDYQRLVEVLDRLIDLVGEDESHPLASMMEVVGVWLPSTKRNMFLSWKRTT